jgi:hypothetical protein
LFKLACCVEFDGFEIPFEKGVTYKYQLLHQWQKAELLSPSAYDVKPAIQQLCWRLIP